MTIQVKSACDRYVGEVRQGVSEGGMTPCAKTVQAVLASAWMWTVVIFAGALVALLAACGGAGSPHPADGSGASANSGVPSDALVERSPASDAATGGGDKKDREAQGDMDDDEKAVLERLDVLVQENWKCVREIFLLHGLPVEMYTNDGSMPDIIPVVSDEFKTFDDLKTYVESVYCEAEANALLYGSSERHAPYTGRYMDKGGVLSIDMTTDGGMGYYTDWSDPKLDIVNLTDDRCDFQATVKEDVQPTSEEKKDVTFDMAAVKEGGEWKLEKMVY